MHPNIIAKQLKINGIVQGVGFRPHVYQLATRHRIYGEVANTSSGVEIHAEGIPENVQRFCSEIRSSLPPLAKITKITVSPTTVKAFNNFSIICSIPHDTRSTLISPDVSICADCLKELLDPDDRRYGYPFINCTNCGPRYTIISDIPYDRPNTSMKPFAMCPQCQAEYDDPENRRFHAQPNACHVCGPRVSLFDRHRIELTGSNPIEQTAHLLKQGYIVAIKGLGGFHLAVDAENEDAVNRLRERKRREEKPFALMSYDLTLIKQYAFIEPDEEFLLACYQKPIVLLKKKEPNPLSTSVSPRNHYFGVMLPYTPLHYLLLKHGFIALVMTSGNISEEPIVIDNDEAFNRLSGIADYFLIHNRDIYLRTDDSIVKYAAEGMRFIRRSRGYVPVPIFLKREIPQILGVGAELKNTVCLAKGDQAFLSQHIGDLENMETYRFFEMTIDHMKRLLSISPDTVAFDLHPDYMSTRYAQELDSVKKIAVQHHHAHIVSCMTENQIDGPVIGLAFDGTGYGTDGNIWGGEILIAESDRFQRAGHLEYLPMPGSASAIKEPWRMGISFLFDAFNDEFSEFNLPILKSLCQNQIFVTLQMIRKQVNCPLTSSLGRLFDGVAAIIGIRNTVYYEGQAAMELEMAASSKVTGAYPFEWETGDVRKIKLKPIIRSIVHDVQHGIPAQEISSKFHNTLVTLFSEFCRMLRTDTGLNRVVLSGGVFQNGILLNGLKTSLEKMKFQVYTHEQVPANDGGISLGQVGVAAATLMYENVGLRYR